MRAGSRQGRHAPDDAHRKDHIRALPTLEEIAQDIDSPRLLEITLESFQYMPTARGNSGVSLLEYK